MVSKADMKADNWYWIEAMFRKIPLPHRLTSIFISIILYLIYIGFSVNVYDFELIDIKNRKFDYAYNLVVLSTCILVPYQVLGIQYIRSKFRDMLNLNIVYDLSPESNEFYFEVKQRVFNSYGYYLTIILVIVPFVMVDYMNYGTDYYFHKPEGTILCFGFLLDIYNKTLSYFIHIMFAIILWIIICISWTLNELGKENRRSLIKINIFSIDEMGGLKSIRDLILKITMYYFVGITLGIMSYTTPLKTLRFESIFYIILLFVGFIYLFKCLRYMKAILSYWVRYETSVIDDMCLKQHQIFMNIVSKESYDNKKNDIEEVSAALDTLYKDRERITQINKLGYNFKEFTIYIGSIILPILALVEKLTELFSHPP